MKYRVIYILIWNLIIIEKREPRFSIHVPLYNPYLSPTSNNTLGVLWAANLSIKISVAICSIWDFQKPGQVCNITDNDLAADMLRKSGVSVYHYIPVQKLPVSKFDGECCNSLLNISRFIFMALNRPNAIMDGIFFDGVPGNNKSLLPFFGNVYKIAKYGYSERPIIINTAGPVFLKEHFILGGKNFRVNAFENTFKNLQNQTKATHLFNWNSIGRTKFSAIVENVYTIQDIPKVMKKLWKLGYGVVFMEPDEQDYWNLPTYWKEFVLFVLFY